MRVPRVSTATGEYHRGHGYYGRLVIEDSTLPGFVGQAEFEDRTLLFLHFYFLLFLTYCFPHAKIRSFS
jgi:hypothetical protein